MVNKIKKKRFELFTVTFLSGNGKIFDEEMTYAKKPDITSVIHRNLDKIGCESHSNTNI